jgi:hypothetical protein
MTLSTFASLSHVPQKNVTDIKLCTLIKKFTMEDNFDIEAFRLLVVGGDDNDVPDTFVSGHCASKALCFRENYGDPAALLISHRCPGCAQAVHEECGYYNPTVEDETDEITCLSCFNKFGRVMGKVDDSDYIPERKNGLTDPSSTPSRSTRAVKLTGGRASLNPKVPSPKTTISAYWREKQVVADTKIDEGNPSYM